MDIVTYALAKKMASSVASGITEVQTDGTNIRFKTAEGEWFTVRLNSVEDATVSGTGHLIIELTDGTTIDAGVLPVGTMDTALSATSENGVQNKVITAALNGKQNVLTAGTGVTIDNTDPANPEISANVDYTNLINKPTKLSDFTNDQDFIDNTVNNLTNYYLKTQTYTQTEVNDLISHLASLSVEIVETLPTEDISTTTIYLVNVPGTTNYAQWMYINNAWSNIGNTSVDLSNYYNKGQTDTLLDAKVDKVLGKGLSTNDFSNAYKDILDNYTVDSVLDSSSTNPIQNGTVTDALNTKQPKTLSTPIVVGGVSSTTVEGTLGNLNALVDTKLPMVTSLPASPSNGEAVLYIGTASGGLKTGGIYQYQVSEWVLISSVNEQKLVVMNISNSDVNVGEPFYTDKTNSMEVFKIIADAMFNDIDTSRVLKVYTGHATAYTTDDSGYPNVGVSTYIASSCWGANRHPYIRIRIFSDGGNEYIFRRSQDGTYALVEAPDVRTISNPFTVNTGKATNAYEIGVLKQGRVVQFKVYIESFKNIALETWNTLGTVADAIKPAMETPLLMSDGRVINATAFSRITSNGELQIWGTEALNTLSSRFSATYLSAE